MNEEENAEMEDKIREIADKHNAEILIHRAPTDPKEHKKWAKRMTRVVIAMQYVGQKCAHCGHVYSSVDDFMERKPKQGYDEDWCVCSKCWLSYLKKRGEVKG